jgi:hypothetical protein
MILICGIGDFQDEAITYVGEHPIGTALGVGTVALGVGVAAGAIIGAKAKKKIRRSTTKRGRSRDSRFKSKQKHERKYKRKRKYKVYGKKGWIHPKIKKRKVNSKRRGKIYYARKTGQPYIILSNGKAKFIKGKRRK